MPSLGGGVLLCPALIIKLSWLDIYNLFFCFVLLLFTHLSSRFRFLTPSLVCVFHLGDCQLLPYCLHLVLITRCIKSVCSCVALPVRLCFSMFLAFQQLLLIAFLLPITACLTSYVSAFSLPDTLPFDRLPACVPTLDRNYHELCRFLLPAGLTDYELCRCLPPVGLLYPCLDCLNLYCHSTVKLVNCTFLCLRVVRLDPHTSLHLLQPPGD